ncbi:MAG: TIGR04282 family arsenosugar biosynthesis glycosyltransferase [Rubrivivax sp.]
MSSSTALIVFARAPVAGQAKTRLIPALGAAGAAALAERLLAHALDTAMSAGFEHVELCAAPDSRHPALARWAGLPGLMLADQGDGDLGERMHRALTRALRQHPRALLMGSDVPALGSHCLVQAAAALAYHDAVFVPALDGGYALVGLCRPAPQLFAGIAWSSALVMAQTRALARQTGLRWAELPAVADIDEPADLARLPAGWLP